MKLFKKKVKVRKDYREFNADNMKSWGHNAFWTNQDIGKMCIFGPRPSVGDIIIVDGKYHVVETSKTYSDPGDQHFVTLRELKKPPAPSTRIPNWTDGLV